MQNDNKAAEAAQEETQEQNPTTSPANAGEVPAHWFLQSVGELPSVLFYDIDVSSHPCTPGYDSRWRCTECGLCVVAERGQRPQDVDEHLPPCVPRAYQTDDQLQAERAYSALRAAATAMPVDSPRWSPAARYAYNAACAAAARYVLELSAYPSVAGLLVILSVLEDAFGEFVDGDDYNWDNPDNPSLTPLLTAEKPEYWRAREHLRPDRMLEGIAELRRKLEGLLAVREVLGA